MSTAIDPAGLPESSLLPVSWMPTSWSVFRGVPLVVVAVNNPTAASVPGSPFGPVAERPAGSPWSRDRSGGRSGPG
jgi:hypothetical protein